MFTTESSKGNLLIQMLLILSCESHSFIHTFQNLAFSIHVGDCWELYIYIFIGVNGNEGFVIPHWSTPPEPLQFFKLHPLVSYKFRPPPIYLTYIFRAFEKSDIAFSFLLSNSSSRVIHSALCV